MLREGLLTFEYFLSKKWTEKNNESKSTASKMLFVTNKKNSRKVTKYCNESQMLRYKISVTNPLAGASKSSYFGVTF